MPVKDKGTEQLIKDTAKKIFFAEGKLHATTQDIADAAGVNRTLVHYYFRSRKHLFELVTEEALDELRQIMGDAFIGKQSFKEKLKKLIHVFMDQTIAFPYRELFLITETNRYDQGHADQVHDSHTKPFLEEVKAEMDKGNIKAMDPRHFMMNLFSLMAYPLLTSTLSKGFMKIDDHEYAKLMKQRKQLILEMIYPE
ncbi:TetR family transcriptional regulator [Pedobacter lusitanus]|uniref:TetR family transcriptional regulator n=1 Tax=Pedobacter lusitanus TaxID=1503925 RepID=A0A0D0F5W6_9SPHI|nr:TetR/AcrR family transcriptional regulator [Pedobacter lusitanus]KIO77023.1 TetR family transcriptional regulator [Pedobacter lusitanus]